MPESAITLELATLLGAHRVRALPFGAGKSAIVRHALEEPADAALPAIPPREHADAELWLDPPAGQELGAGP